MSVVLTLLILGLTAIVILGGVRAGIERVTKMLMPALIILMLVLAGRAATLPGATEGLLYYLRPDLSRLLDPSLYSAALGQAFFSLSLGMGAMITYGSYLGKREGIAGAAVWVVLLDTAIALLAGFIIFPSGFSIPGFDPSSSGPGLIFTVLPPTFFHIARRPALRRRFLPPAHHGRLDLNHLVARGAGSPLRRRTWVAPPTVGRARGSGGSPALVAVGLLQRRGAVPVDPARSAPSTS